MATSGSFTTTSYEGRSLTFSWNRTSTNIANNTSTIAWSVTGSGSYTAGWVTCGDIDVVINGTTVYNSAAESRINVWSGTVVASGTATIAHNADGSKSFSASVNAAIYNYAQNCSGSGTWALDSIPRASNIDKIANTSGTSISALNTGNDIRVYFTPKSTAFKYRITVSMNGSSAQNNSAGVTVSSTSQTYYQVNIPHTWLSNKESDTLTCKLETLNGTTVIGTNTKTIAMSVPSSIVPTLGTPSSTPVNANTTISGWAIYVAGYSKARIVCTASGSNGSTISRFQITGSATATVNGTSLSYDVNLSSSGVKTFTISAIDSRGRSTAAKSISINVQSYAAPSVQPLTVIRSDANGNASASGTNAKLSFIGYYSNIGSNAATATFAYKLSTATTYTNISNTATGSGGTINGSIVLSTITFAAASEYDFKITITDSLGNAVSRTARLSSVSRTLNVAKYGNGVAIGKMSTISSQTAAGKLEVGWDADFDKAVNIDGKLTLAGGLSAPLSIANGGTGTTTSAGIAKSHYHTNIGVANAGGGTSGYLKIATIRVTAANMNQPIEFKIARRGDKISTDISIAFQNTSSTDPSVVNFNRFGVSPAWLSKVSAGVWDLYVQKNEGWDNVSILGINKGEYLNSVTVTLTNVHTSTLPSDVIQANLIDFVEEQGTSGVWVYRKWHSGFAECWGYHTVSGLNISTAWGSWYSSPAIVLPSFPFTFSGTLDVHVSWESDFSAIIDGVGKRESTKAGQVYLYRPVAQTNVNGRFSIYAYGKWK